MYKSIKRLARRLPPVRRAFERQAAHYEQRAASLLEENAQLRHEADLLRTSVAKATEQLAGTAQRIIPEHAKVVYSHWGEDSIIDFVFANMTSGRYLDIGCYHPALYSNTMQLYTKGWNGVNIDPNPFMIEQCLQMRPRDISLKKAVGGKHGSIEYFSFHDWASSNTASEEFARAISVGQNLQMPTGQTVELVTLAEIMEAYFSDAAPDFVNIDVEDLDVDVLKSGDWTRFRPKLVAIEDFKFRTASPGDSAIYSFLSENGYLMVSRCIYTSFFIEQSFNKKSLNLS
jgi:FkbM family methyltransferase